ncbi:F-box/LRR-repeat protein 13-like isoform X2 [Asparagus officinalis]|uniref:F-box/LRR-repeat protein 13-like isoform X2 n=1 Tax=Asparagus officinalis TaxID=4686 RepID=UPI00098E1FA0|nr:F-box/LRR-repeat protein 13-like isoform X2 [Asparagus officinalis]
MEESMTVIHNCRRKRIATEDQERKRKRTDGINNLTDDTLCYILSFLSTKEATRTSILSKRWKNIWKSTGSIKLDIDEVLGVFPHVNTTPNQRAEEFFRVVTKCLCENFNPLTKTLHLHLCSVLPDAHVLYYWFSLMMRSHLDNLVLDFSGAPRHCPIPYNLLFPKGDELRLKSLSLTHCDILRPLNTVSNHYCSSLVSLALSDVILPKNFIDFIASYPLLRCLTIQDCSIENMEMKILCGGFKPLRVLGLRCMKLTQELVDNLLTNFSLLEQLSLDDCAIMPFDSSPLEIRGPINLNCLEVSKCRGLKELRVFATRLERFALISKDGMDLLPRVTFKLLDDDCSDFSSIQGKGSLLRQLELQCIEFSIDLPQFSCLETVRLEQVHLEEEYITVLLSNCLLLEKLSIIKCDGLPLLSIIGPSLQLKQLTVCWCNHLKKLEICEMNLVQLEYHGELIVFSLREVSHLVSVEMEIDTDDDNSLIHVLTILSRDVPRLETLIFYIEGGKVPESFPVFYTLKHLVLFLGRYVKVTKEFSWATNFLATSPLLEIFQLQLSRCLLEDPILRTDKPTLSAAWQFTNQYLKEIELLGFRGDDKEIEFACNLLQNAKSSLKMMKIDGGSKHRAGSHTAAPPAEWVQSGRQKSLKEIKSRIDAVPVSVERSLQSPIQDENGPCKQLIVYGGGGSAC